MNWNSSGAVSLCLFLCLGVIGISCSGPSRPHDENESKSEHADGKDEHAEEKGGHEEGIVALSAEQIAVAKIKTRKTKVASWFLDLTLVMGYWGAGAKRTYHHTAPVNALYGLHEALVMLQEEGLENAHARHLRNHQALRAGLENLGFEYIGKDGARLPQLNAVKLPAGVDEVKLRAILLNEFNLEIGAGLGALAGKILRIGLMGHASNNRNVLFCLAALEAALVKARSAAPVAVHA